MILVNNATTKTEPHRFKGSVIEYYYLFTLRKLYFRFRQVLVLNFYFVLFIDRDFDIK